MNVTIASLTWWPAARRVLARWAHVGNLLDFATTLIAVVGLGDTEVGLLPAWLTHHGLPVMPTMFLVKGLVRGDHLGVLVGERYRTAQ